MSSIHLYTDWHSCNSGWLILDPNDDPRLVWTDDDHAVPDCLKLWFLSK